MNRAEVFDALEDLDITKVEVHFNGGNDNGGVEFISYFRGEEKIKDLNVSDELEEALGEPVYDKYSSFAGEFYVSGMVVWNVVDMTVKINGSESEEVWHPFEENL